MVEQPDLVDVARPPTPHTKVIESHETDGILGGVETHRAVERVVVLDIERQVQAGEIRARQVLQRRWLK